MFTDKTSEPGESRRYRFFLILIIVIIVLILIEGGEAFRFKPERINTVGLVAYIVVVLVLFQLIMKWYNKLSKEKQDGLENFWSFLHFCFYFGLAYFIPDNWIVIIPLMVTWEFYEDFMGFEYDKETFIEDDGKKMFDIVCNSAGYWIGSKFFSELKSRGRRLLF